MISVYWFAFFFLLVMAALPIILLAEYCLRPIRMKMLAYRFGLSYKLQHGFLITDGRRNIIKGKLGKNTIELYDYSYSKGFRPLVSQRKTRLLINRHAYELQGRISGYYSAQKLQDILTEIQKRKGLYPCPSRSAFLSGHLEKRKNPYNDRENFPDRRITNILELIIVVILVIVFIVGMT